MGMLMLFILAAVIRAFFWITDIDRIKRDAKKATRPCTPMDHDHDLDVGDYQMILRHRYGGSDSDFDRNFDDDFGVEKLPPVQGRVIEIRNLSGPGPGQDKNPGK